MGKKFIIAATIIALCGLLIFTLVNKMKSSRGGGANKSDTTTQKRGRNGTDDTPVESLTSISAITARQQEQIEALEAEKKAAAEIAEAEKNSLLSALETLTGRFEEVTGSINENMDKVNNRITDEMEKRDSEIEVGQEIYDENDLIWLAPKRREPSEPLKTSGGAKSRVKGLLDKGKNAVGVASQLPDGSIARESALRRGRGGNESAHVEPVYTIPVNATLTGARAMTGVIGRIPAGSNLRNPVRFKIKTGAENLISNGIKLPEIREAVWSGYAFGDRTLKCVRGVVDAVTFTFADGRIATFPESGQRDSSSSGGNGTRLDELDKLGWLSDPKGNCISGEYITNAPENLSKLFLAGFAAGAADGVARSQIQINGTGLGAALSGNALEFAAGNGGSEGLNAWAEYIEARAREDFDVVYVESGRELVLNITNQIEIDYNFGSRKVNYFGNEGVSNDLH